jgi:hypothetical protein
VLGAIAATSVALLTGSGTGRPWAENAVQWIAARDRASHRSVAELLMFEAADSVHLLCCNQVGPIQGRAAVAGFVAGTFSSIEKGVTGRSYIDVSGAVVEYRLTPGSDGDRPPGWGDRLGPDELLVSEHAADGAATRTVHGASLQFLTAPVYDARTWFGEDLAASRGLVDRYLSAWSGRDGRAVGALYGENATLLDSVLGVRRIGRDAIGSFAAEHGGAPLRLDAIPGGGGPALYGYWPEYRGPLTAYLTYTGDDGTGCPGGVTAQLQIEKGRIVAERRYHDVASMRSCVSASELPDGWWTHAVLPAPVEDRVTGTVTVAGRRVEVHNGTEAADDLVRWAMGRFPTAHLGMPDVASVAFDEHAHPVECSSDRWGLARPQGRSSSIYLCDTVEGAAATPFQRSMMLHELAHAWMWQNLDEPTREQFLARMQLRAWDAPGVPWETRGMEQAADVIAWGLAEAPLQGRELADRSCAELTQAFELLTGAAPLHLPCPPRR